MLNFAGKRSEVTQRERWARALEWGEVCGDDDDGVAGGEEDERGSLSNLATLSLADLSKVAPDPIPARQSSSRECRTTSTWVGAGRRWLKFLARQESQKTLWPSAQRSEKIGGLAERG